MKLDPCLKLCRRGKKYLNVNPKPRQLLREHANILGIGLGSNFLDVALRRATKANVNEHNDLKPTERNTPYNEVRVQMAGQTSKPGEGGLVSNV